MRAKERRSGEIRGRERNRLPGPSRYVNDSGHYKVLKMHSGKKSFQILLEIGKLKV